MPVPAEAQCDHWAVWLSSDHHRERPDQNAATVRSQVDALALFGDHGYGQDGRMLVMLAQATPQHSHPQQSEEDAMVEWPGRPEGQ
jgi:hypothetical protein